MPKHEGWAGALWGGTKQAASNAYTLGKQVVTGEAEFGDKSFKIDRGMSLKMLPGAVSGAFKAHTFSLRDPAKFAEMQSQIKTFQTGGGGQAAPQGGAPPTAH
ncbi:hypothetical protein IV102_13825 [bacterium]|nr:hypothetical protein [bacterium]